MRLMMVMPLYCSLRDIDYFAASFASWSAFSFPATLAWPGIQDRVVRISSMSLCFTVLPRQHSKMKITWYFFHCDTIACNFCSNEHKHISLHYLTCQANNILPNTTSIKTTTREANIVPVVAIVVDIRE